MHYPQQQQQEQQQREVKMKGLKPFSPTLLLVTRL
jgi:hypothetical protein